MSIKYAVERSYSFDPRSTIVSDTLMSNHRHFCHTHVIHTCVAVTLLPANKLDSVQFKFTLYTQKTFTLYTTHYMGKIEFDANVSMDMPPPAFNVDPLLPLISIKGHMRERRERRTEGGREREGEIERPGGEKWKKENIRCFQLELSSKK